jgi:hypothetical protein
MEAYVYVHVLCICYVYCVWRVLLSAHGYIAVSVSSMSVVAVVYRCVTLLNMLYGVHHISNVLPLAEDMGSPEDHHNIFVVWYT